MQIAHRSLASSLAAVALVLASAPSFGSTVTYLSSAAFLAHVGPGAYTENFDGLANLPSGPVPFSGGGFSYTISAPGDIYASGDFVGTSFPYEVLTINFTSGNVTALGGNFFSSDLGDAFVATPITLTLSDATSVTFTPTSASDSYRGFTSDVAISSLTMTLTETQFQSLYAGLDNLTVGAVPEPGTLALLGLGMTGLLVSRRRTVV
ncbi:MAG: PEP-CTERM sorting domain-containing protein [Burkholderiaceae bacterium]